MNKKSIWFTPNPDLKLLNEQSGNTLVSHLDIEFTDISENSITATMPVDARTVQPMRRLHGGASAALAETLGSIAAWLTMDPQGGKAPVGIELNINHIRPAFEGCGKVTGVATPVHLGQTLQVWEIKIYSPESKLLAVSRLTVSIISVTR